MLDARPLPHVIAAFRDEAQDRVRAESMDLAQVGTEQSVERGSKLELGFVAIPRMSHFRQWRGGQGMLTSQLCECSFNFDITLVDLRGRECISRPVNPLADGA